MRKVDRNPGVQDVIRSVVWTAVGSGVIPIWMIVLAGRGRGGDGPGVWAASTFTLIIGSVVAGGVLLGLRRGRHRRD